MDIREGQGFEKDNVRRKESEPEFWSGSYMMGEPGGWLILGKESVKKGQLFEDIKKENSRHTLCSLVC